MSSDPYSLKMMNDLLILLEVKMLTRKWVFDGVGHCLSSNVLDMYCFLPSCETVHIH